MTNPTTRIRELLEAAAPTGDISRAFPRSKALLYLELHRLAPAMCDVIDAAKHALEHFRQLDHDAVCNGVHAPDGQCEGEHWAAQTEERLQATLDALDRAAEEGRSQGSSMQGGEG